MTIDSLSLIKEIHENFGSVPYPGDEKIVPPSITDHLERKDIYSALNGQHWTDISFETIHQLQSALFFLTPEGYRFYLPAFMVYSISDFFGSDVIPDEVIQTLTPPSLSDIDRLVERILHRSETQLLPAEEWEQILKAIAKSYGDGSAEYRFLERISGFDHEQPRTIRRYLQYMNDVHGEQFTDKQPQVALERYWKKCRSCCACKERNKKTN